jgi:hypothetical protein
MARSAQCLRSHKLNGRCVTCGELPQLLHIPLKQAGFFCPVCVESSPRVPTRKVRQVSSIGQKLRRPRETKLVRKQVCGCVSVGAPPLVHQPKVLQLVHKRTVVYKLPNGISSMV